MNANNAKDYLPLVKALAEGKVIQLNYNGDWKNISDMEPIYPANFYRIKPEPREIWVNEYAKTQPGYCYFYNSEIEAKNALGNGGETRRYREVIE